MAAHPLLIFLVTFLSNNAWSVEIKCPRGQHFVRAHFREAYVRSDGTKVSSANVSAHCKKNSRVYSFWNSRFKERTLSNWPNHGEISKKWSLSEKARVLEALELLPTILWENTDIALFRMAKSKTPSNPGSSAPKVVVLYDEAFEAGRNLAQVVSHELAHEYYRGLSREKVEEYATMNGWAPLIGGKKWVTSRTKFVASDSQNSPEEDFANNIEYFLFNPFKLKAKAPTAYEWIKNHFGDNFKLRRKKK